MSQLDDIVAERERSAAEMMKPGSNHQRVMEYQRTHSGVDRMRDLSSEFRARGDVGRADALAAAASVLSEWPTATSGATAATPAEWYVDTWTNDLGSRLVLERNARGRYVSADGHVAEFLEWGANGHRVEVVGWFPDAYGDSYRRVQAFLHHPGSEELIGMFDWQPEPKDMMIYSLEPAFRRGS
jgi:hypothetical protein